MRGKVANMIVKTSPDETTGQNKTNLKDKTQSPGLWFAKNAHDLESQWSCWKQFKNGGHVTPPTPEFKGKPFKELSKNTFRAPK